MNGYHAGLLVLLVLAPWIVQTAWMAAGAFRDWLWFEHRIDPLRRWR